MSAETESQNRPSRRAHWLVWVFAIVGLLGVVAIIFIALTLSNMGGRYQPAKVAGAAPETVFSIGNVQSLGNSNLVRMDITVSGGGRGSGSYSGGYGEGVRNILLLDRGTGASRKLLPDNKHRIAESHFLAAESDFEVGGNAARPDIDISGAEGDLREKPESPAAYYALEIERDGADGIDLLVGTLSSGRQAYVMRGLDGIDSIWMDSPTRIGVIVRERLHLYYRIVDIPSLTTIVSKPIDIG
jgi:hypothetical protein